MSNVDENKSVEVATPAVAPEQGPVVEGVAAAATVESPTVISRRRHWAMGGIAAVLVLAAIFGIPRVMYVMGHASTDDATVNSHVSYVSSRVPGITEEVMVDDNQFVEAGTLLVRLDAKPYQLELEQAEAMAERAKLGVRQKMAAPNVAKVQLEQARTQIRAQISRLRGDWYLIASVQDFVHYATASLRANVATLAEKQANRRLAQEEFDRVTHLGIKAVSQEEIDQRKSALDAAVAQEASAAQTVLQSRALLGLGPDDQDPGSVPANVSQIFNGTQYAVASFQEALASLGVPFDTLSPRLNDLRDRFLSMTEEQTIEQAPSVVTVKAQVAAAMAALGADVFDPNHPDLHPDVVEAQKQLEQAKLRLSYTRVCAPIAGIVSRRVVNPGLVVQSGQSLLSIRPLENVWVDANFKETQLNDLKIGQAVELFVDAYPGRTFHGRVAGFSPGTGAVMSLLPPENASGNFVKVVQRLPVRIELTEPNPKDTPLFAGLSVEPEVDIRSTPEGPDAGQRLASVAAVTETRP